MQIRNLPIDSLKAYDNNARSHSPAQIDEIASSITEFGFNNPILIDQGSVIIAGHGRVLAAKKLGLSEVPTIALKHLTEAKKKAYILADNRIALNAGWYADKLKVEFEALLKDNFDIKLAGFTQDEIDAFLNPEILKEGLDDANAQYELPATPVTKLGDVWLLGAHRVMCGDSTMIDSVEKLVNGVLVNLVLTDPPYGISVVKPDGNIGGNRKGKVGYGEKGSYGKEAKCGLYEPVHGDDQPFDPSFLLTLAPKQIIFGANNFASKLPDNSHWLVWVKDMPEGTDFSGAELAWTNYDKKAVKTYKFTWAGMTRQGNRKDELSNRVHPTQKPVGLFVDILSDHEAKTIIDPFGGSGSTLIACEKTGRKCLMMEISPAYCDVIVRRWENFSGTHATLESTGLSFDEVANGQTRI